MSTSFPARAGHHCTGLMTVTSPSIARSCNSRCHDLTINLPGSSRNRLATSANL